VKVLAQGMLDTGLLDKNKVGQLDDVIVNGDYRQFYMHRTGHWLGMDVHDVGDYKIGDEWRVLEPGMVMTVEPGIYIPAGTRGVPKRFWNIGIRIEDDVMVTAGGCEVLTGDVPNQPSAIEAAMARVT